MGFFAKITASQVCKSYHQEMVHFSVSHDKWQSNLWYNLDTQDCEASQDKSETPARCQNPLAKTDMIHITILEPEGMPIFKESDAWIEEILCSTGRYVPQLRGIFSILDTRITLPARMNIKKGKHVCTNNISDASSANRYERKFESV